jgi:hypothetical protein
MESSLVLLDLPTVHEPVRVGGARTAASRSVAVLTFGVSDTRWRDWFRRRTTAHFGERRFRNLCFPLERFVFFSSAYGRGAAGADD